MKAEIKEQKKNPLLKREEVVLSINHSGDATPSREQILESSSKTLKKDKKVIVVDSIFTEVGRCITNAKILVYSKAEDIPEYKKKRMEKGKKKKKEEAPAEQTEAPKAEEKKEDKPEEKKEDKPEEKPKEEKK